MDSSQPTELPAVFQMLLLTVLLPLLSQMLLVFSNASTAQQDIIQTQMALAFKPQLSLDV